jgi:hypothetical protein
MKNIIGTKMIRQAIFKKLTKKEKEELLGLFMNGEKQETCSETESLTCMTEREVTQCKNVYKSNNKLTKKDKKELATWIKKTPLRYCYEKERIMPFLKDKDVYLSFNNNKLLFDFVEYGFNSYTTKIVFNENVNLKINQENITKLILQTENFRTNREYLRRVDLSKSLNHYISLALDNVKFCHSFDNLLLVLIEKEAIKKSDFKKYLKIFKSKYKDKNYNTNEKMISEITTIINLKNKINKF